MKACLNEFTPSNTLACPSQAKGVLMEAGVDLSEQVKGVEAAMEEAKEEMKAKDVEQTIEVPGVWGYVLRVSGLGSRVSGL